MVCPRAGASPAGNDLRVIALWAARGSVLRRIVSSLAVGLAAGNEGGRMQKVSGALGRSFNSKKVLSAHRAS